MTLHHQHSTWNPSPRPPLIYVQAHHSKQLRLMTLCFLWLLLSKWPWMQAVIKCKRMCLGPPKFPCEPGRASGWLSHREFWEAQGREGFMVTGSLGRASAPQSHCQVVAQAAIWRHITETRTSMVLNDFWQACLALTLLHSLKCPPLTPAGKKNTSIIYH